MRTLSRRDPLARAVGLARHGPRAVVDATGGLCRDAMTLAHLGCPVTAIERVPVLALAGALAVRAAGLADRLTLVVADAVAWLRALPATARPPVVYLDPMFEATPRAQVKKEMQVCRALCGPPDDGGALFAAARAAATERVVVKRHGELGNLGGEPSFAATGPRVRFDVYLATPPA
ncbi:MAG: class I SAM-dependent methyltransferase [Planctomycetota bacterium]